MSTATGPAPGVIDVAPIVQALAETLRADWSDSYPLRLSAAGREFEVIVDDVTDDSRVNLTVWTDDELGDPVEVATLRLDVVVVIL